WRGSRGWSPRSWRRQAPGSSSQRRAARLGGSFDHSLVDPQPRIARQAHNPRIEVGIKLVGRKLPDVQRALDPAIAREAAILEVERHTVGNDAIAVGAFHKYFARDEDLFGVHVVEALLGSDRRRAILEPDRTRQVGHPHDWLGARFLH